MLFPHPVTLPLPLCVYNLISAYLERLYAGADSRLYQGAYENTMGDITYFTCIPLRLRHGPLRIWAGDGKDGRKGGALQSAALV